MTSNQQILADLRVVMETGHALELINTYKGVPFICKAKVICVEEEQVCLKAEDPSLVCLSHDPQIKVLGSEYFEPSVARVVSMDLPCGQIVLNDFRYLGSRLGERTIVRVEPKENIHAWLECEKQKFNGELADLSMSGIGVRLPSSQYHPVLKPGANLQVQIELPSAVVRATGTILSATRAGDVHRLSIRFAADHAYKVAIFHYLIDRRNEIEEELRQDYERESHG